MATKQERKEKIEALTKMFEEGHINPDEAGDQLLGLIEHALFDCEKGQIETIIDHVYFPFQMMLVLKGLRK